MKCTLTWASFKFSHTGLRFWFIFLLAAGRVLALSLKTTFWLCRLDTTLIDFTDMKCQRGDLSFIFNGNAIPSESFVVLDNEQKVYQRIHHEVGQRARGFSPSFFSRSASECLLFVPSC